MKIDVNITPIQVPRLTAKYNNANIEITYGELTDVMIIALCDDLQARMIAEMDKQAIQNGEQQ